MSRTVAYAVAGHAGKIADGRVILPSFTPSFDSDGLTCVVPFTKKNSGSCRKPQMSRIQAAGVQSNVSHITRLLLVWEIGGCCGISRRFVIASRSDHHGPADGSCSHREADGLLLGRPPDANVRGRPRRAHPHRGRIEHPGAGLCTRSLQGGQ
jgi:hypothetical protein